MVGLTEEISGGILGKTDGNSCLNKDTSTIPLNLPPQLIFVRYRDHVLYNRSSVLAMQPQVREAVGWLVSEYDEYVTLSWDRDNKCQPPDEKETS